MDGEAAREVVAQDALDAEVRRRRAQDERGGRQERRESRGQPRIKPLR
jgi:hypothetical protein